MFPFITKNPWLHNPRLLLGAYIGLAAAITGYQLWVRPDSINNFTIFRTSFEHLARNEDLYALHPGKHHDVFRYGPTFAFFMAPFRALPVGVGLLLWNLCNALVLFWAVQRLRLKRPAAAFVLLFVLPQLHGAIQNTQSNGIMAGLMVGTVGAFERRTQGLAALQACLGFFVKVYGAGVGLLFLMYDRKIRFLLTGVAWGLFLGLLPLPLTGARGLIEHYKEWFEQLRGDTTREMKYSIMTVAEKWFGSAPPDWAFVLPGLVLLLLPLARVSLYRDRAFRVMYCGYIMVFVVIFNKMAESPTYVIAMTGVALWGLVEPASRFKTALLVLTFVVTGLSHSDLCPRIVRDRIVGAYALKAVPCILVWGVMAWRLLSVKPGQLRADVFATDSADPVTSSRTPATARPA